MAQESNSGTGMGMPDIQSYMYLMNMMRPGASGLNAIASTNPYFGAAMSTLGTIQAVLGFKNLNKSAPSFALTPAMKESIAEANNMRGMGYSPQEMAAAENSISRGENTGYQKAVDMAPNLSQAIRAGINYNNVQAKLGLAANDAKLHRENIRYSDSMNEREQQIANMNTQAKLGEWNKEQQAFGQAAQTGINNFMYGLGSVLPMPGAKTNAPLAKRRPSIDGNINSSTGDSINYGMDDYNYA